MLEKETPSERIYIYMVGLATEIYRIHNVRREKKHIKGILSDKTASKEDDFPLLGKLNSRSIPTISQRS